MIIAISTKTTKATEGDRPKVERETPSGHAISTDTRVSASVGSMSSSQTPISNAREMKTRWQLTVCRTPRLSCLLRQCVPRMRCPRATDSPCHPRSRMLTQCLFRQRWRRGPSVLHQNYHPSHRRLRHHHLCHHLRVGARVVARYRAEVVGSLLRRHGRSARASIRGHTFRKLGGAVRGFRRMSFAGNRSHDIILADA